MKLYYQVYTTGMLEEIYHPPIIFLHMMGGSGKTFKKVAPAIGEKTKRKVYVPDARNHGKSPWVNEMNYDLLTQDLLEFMQQNKIPKAILIGSSMGGRIAINFALKHPHKVDALVVEEMTPRNISSSGNNLVQYLFKQIYEILDDMPPELDLDGVKLRIYEQMVDIFETFIDKEKYLRLYDPDMIPLVKEGNMIKTECNAEVIHETMVDNDSLVQNLPDLNITYDGKALFLYGSKGFFNLAKDPSIQKLFPAATVKRVEGATHLLHLDSSEEYINIVTDFILNKNYAQSKY